MEDRERLENEYLINANQWVVGINRPYYPSAEFFDDIIPAQERYRELKEEHENDGEYMVKVFIAKVVNLEEILTYY